MRHNSDRPMTGAAQVSSPGDIYIPSSFLARTIPFF